jgi:hypothetical protein
MSSEILRCEGLALFPQLVCILGIHGIIGNSGGRVTICRRVRKREEEKEIER